MKASAIDDKIELDSGGRDELALSLLRALEANPDMSQRQLAAALDVSLGGVNFAIQALRKSGYIKARRFRNSDSKIAYLYLLTPAGLRQKTYLMSTFLARKLAEYEVLRAEIVRLKQDLEECK